MKPASALAMPGPAFRAAAPAALRGVKRLYLGDEFCSNLLPDGEDMRRAASLGAAVTLVTPLLSDEAFDRVEALAGGFPRGSARLEIVVNDLGLLRVLRGRRWGRVAVSLGRVLGHRVKVMPPDFARAFLKEHRVSRVELDDPALLPRFEPFGLKVSYHLPFRYISTTRFCPWELHWPAPCSFACLGRVRKLEHPRLPAPLLLSGQAYGLRSAAAPRHPLIDRVVTGPRLKVPR